MAELQGDPAYLPARIARDVRQSAVDAKVPAPRQRYFAECIGEITLETQIAGASLLTLTVNDYDWMLQASGFLDVDDDGLVPIVDVNFPPDSGSWWRLCMIQGTISTDSTDPNLTLTFEDRIVSYLREEWGPFVIGRGLQTRAQCVARLVAQVGQKGGQTAGDKPITFVCPSEDIVQPIATTTSSSDTSGTQIVTPPTSSSSAKANKSQGIGVGAALTVLGTPITAQQVAICNAALGAGVKLKASLAALQACMYAGMGESALGADPGASQNVWQADSPGDYGPSPNWAAMATAFFEGTGDFESPGAIAAAQRGDQVWVIANETEGNRVWNESKQDSYASHWTGGQAQGLNEARAIVSAYSGGSLDSLETGDTTVSNPTSDVSQLTRGTSDNPDESSWDCIQRLASDVQWFAFSNANTMFFMDGYDLVGQKPAAYIRLVQDDGPRWDLIDGEASNASVVSRDVIASLDYTFDDSSFIYRSTHTRRGRVQRKSRIATPQTPSEIQINMVCGYDAYRAGDVFVFQDAGPINGRWIVSDATRNCLGDTFTQFTLEPPIAPSPEPASTNSSGSTSIVSADKGIVDGAGGDSSISGYVNPFSRIKGLTPNRIDQGVDYAGSGPILALGNATIQLVYPLGGGSGWPGGGWITYQLSDGPFAGKLVYIAENISPSVHAGQTVQAGDQIATLVDGYPNCETGWASGENTQPLAAHLGQNAQQNGQSSDPGGHASQCGNNFNQLLMALGCPSGTANGTPNGQMPAGWPKITKSGSTTSSATESAVTLDAQSHDANEYDPTSDESNTPAEPEG